MFDLTNWKENHYDFYHPFRALEDFEKEFWHPTFRSDFRVDLKDCNDAYCIEADLPGFEKEDLQISIQGNHLTVHAKRQEEEVQNAQSGNYIHRERFYGSFNRSFDITGVDAEKITAQYQNGVLKLRLPKQEQSRPTARQLEIQ